VLLIVKRYTIILTDEPI